MAWVSNLKHLQCIPGSEFGGYIYSLEYRFPSGHLTLVLNIFYATGTPLGSMSLATSTLMIVYPTHAHSLRWWRSSPQEAQIIKDLRCTSLFCMVLVYVQLYTVLRFTSTSVVRIMLEA